MQLKAPKTSATQGIVAFIDILGYQNFIDNNSVEKAVRILSEVFSGLKEAIVEEYKSSWSNKNADVVRLENVKHQILSDSVILHLECSGIEPSSVDWITFLQTVRVLQRRLLENGFPARGAIAAGKYYLGEGFLVGKPFMESFRLTGQLEFSGTALTPGAFKQFKKSCEAAKLKWTMYKGGIEFLAPLKGNKEERMYCLSPLRAGEVNSELAQTLSSFVSKAFWAHDKDVAMSVDTKVANTTKFLNYWICRIRK